MIIRKLEKDDKKDFLLLLSQLTEVGNITDDTFISRFNDIINNKNINIYILLKKNKIIGCGTLFIEPKFIHNCSNLGHIEDIVIDKNERGNGYGKYLINFLVKIASLSCYKVILSCNIKNKKFYEKCNFKNENIEMCYRY